MNAATLNVLVVDDEFALRQIVAATLAKAGYAVEQAGCVAEARAKLARGEFDVALCDIRMPDGTGIDLLRESKAAGIGTVFVMVTASASMETAVEALRAGAYDYIVKPVRNEELLNRLAQIEAVRGLKEENRLLRAAVKGAGAAAYRFRSPCMLEVERLVNKVAPTSSTVLITGESGSGKGVLARAIHEKSPRSGGPFVPVNCGAIPEQLLESEFFGHTRGSFTGADRARKGLFLEADRGTLFLDEIGELPMPMQTKLLHAIEEKHVRAVGSEQSRPVDIRIVIATNSLFVARQPARARQVINRARILAENNRITLADLPDAVAGGALAASAEPVEAGEGDTLRLQLRRYEIKLLQDAIAAAEGDRRVAAQRLGISLSSLYRKLGEATA